MVQALGYSYGRFDPIHPGRLCRGRERWIQAWEVDSAPTLFRLILSGASFSDDSARDAKRGLNQAGVRVGDVLLRLFPGHRIVAFREDGELAVVPEAVADEDTFLAPRRGGAWFDACQRWRMEVHDADAIEVLVADDNVDGFLILPPKGEVGPELEEALYLLSGMGDGSTTPVRRFQPLGVVEVVQHAVALAAVHLDKHGPALGIYSATPFAPEDEILAMTEEAGILAVPFAIPPMLARWDRALQELRMWWAEHRNGEFPVPPADEPTRWSRMARRGFRGEEEE